MSPEESDSAKALFDRGCKAAAAGKAKLATECFNQSNELMLQKTGLCKKEDGWEFWILEFSQPLTAIAGFGFYLLLKPEPGISRSENLFFAGLTVLLFVLWSVEMVIHFRRRFGTKKESCVGDRDVLLKLILEFSQLTAIVFIGFYLLLKPEPGISRSENLFFAGLTVLLFVLWSVKMFKHIRRRSSKKNGTMGGDSV